jgi:uncharacterized protein with GYD domain
MAMQTFVMLTRLSRGRMEAGIPPTTLEREVMNKIRLDCPEVQWGASYALLGPADYLDIFQAPDVEAAMKVAAIVRTDGHATTETWPALEWDRFKSLIASVS